MLADNFCRRTWLDKAELWIAQTLDLVDFWQRDDDVQLHAASVGCVFVHVLLVAVSRILWTPKVRCSYSLAAHGRRSRKKL